jgi:DNA-binding transcriptional LysR family regulator
VSRADEDALAGTFMRRQPKGNFLQWLRTFVEVAQCGNIHKSAAALCMSPSAVSLHIKKLEEDLGFPLFDRNNHGLSLTEPGRQFKDTTFAALQSIDELRTSTDTKPVIRGTIRLASFNRLAHQFTPAILLFQKMHPEVRFTLQLLPGREVWRNLEDGICDLALIIYSRIPSHLKFKALHPSSAFLYTPPGNPYNLPPAPSWDRICELPFIALTLDGYVNPVIPEVPELRDPENVIITIDDFMLAMKLVKSGLGVCIAPPLTPLENAADYTIFNIDHIFPIGTFGVGYRRNVNIPPQARAFSDFLVEHYTAGKSRPAQPVRWEDLSDVPGLMSIRNTKPV